MKKITFILLILCCATTCSFAAMQPEYLEMKKNGIFLYSQNDGYEAYKIFSRIPEKERDAEIYLLMGNIFQDREKPIEAVYHMKKAIELDSKNYKAFYNLGNLYMEDNKFEAAIENYKKAIKYKSDFAYSYYNIGICKYKLLDYKAAKKYFVKAMIKKPNEPDFYYNLSLTYKKLNNEEKAQKAMDTYTKLKNNE